MLAKLRLLIVEDNKVAAKLLKIHCEKAGFEVDHAPSFATASTLVKQQHYGLIFMDLDLGDGDGKLLTEEIRSTNNPNKATAIIINSAEMYELRKEACFKAGATEVLSKPIHYEKTAEILNSYYGKIEVSESEVANNLQKS